MYLEGQLIEGEEAAVLVLHRNSAWVLVRPPHHQLPHFLIRQATALSGAHRYPQFTDVLIVTVYTLLSILRILIRSTREKRNQASDTKLALSYATYHVIVTELVQDIVVASSYRSLAWKAMTVVRTRYAIKEGPVQQVCAGVQKAHTQDGKNRGGGHVMRGDLSG